MFRRRKRIKSNRVDSLIGAQTELTGDLRFSGDLVVLGAVRGNVIAEDGSGSVLNLSETGRVEGEIRVPNVVVNGVVVGDVYATEQVQLAKNARISGNVYYHLIEMEIGAEVNGALVPLGDQLDSRLKLGHEPPLEPATTMLGSAATRLQTRTGADPAGTGVATLVTLSTTSNDAPAPGGQSDAAEADPATPGVPDPVDGTSRS